MAPTDILVSNSTGMETNYVPSIVTEAKDIQWDTVEYYSDTQDLLNPYYLTDSNELEIEHPDPLPETPAKRALRIKFTLPASSYATIFVRELTHST